MYKKPTNHMYTLKGKGIALVVLFFALAFVPRAYAQDEATISVSGTVISGLSVEAVQDLLLGDIVAGEVKRVNIDGTATGSSPGDEAAGKFRIATLGSFTLSFTDVPSAMIGTGEGNEGVELPVTFHSAWNVGDNVPEEEENVVAIDDNTPVTVEASGEERDVFVFLGAEVTPPATQAQGFYETTITLTATFGVD